MFDYQFWYPVLGLLIAALGLIPAYYTAFSQRNQPMATTDSQASSAGRSNITQSNWWRSPTVIATFVLACLVWGPYILTQMTTKETTTIPNLGITIAGDADQFNRFLNATLSISIDGNLIYKYFPKK